MSVQMSVPGIYKECETSGQRVCNECVNKCANECETGV
ncbi:hypothetical protein Nmel_005012 [Mimus melanotis]